VQATLSYPHLMKKMVISVCACYYRFPIRRPNRKYWQAHVNKSTADAKTLWKPLCGKTRTALIFNIFQISFRVDFLTCSPIQCRDFLKTFWVFVDHTTLPDSKTTPPVEKFNVYLFITHTYGEILRTRHGENGRVDLISVFGKTIELRLFT